MVSFFEMTALESPLIILSHDPTAFKIVGMVLDACPGLSYLGRLDETIEQLWACFWQLPSARAERTRRFEAVRLKIAVETRDGDDAVQMMAVRDVERAERIRVSVLLRTILDRLYDISGRSTACWAYAAMFDASAPDPFLPHRLSFPDARYLCAMPHPLAGLSGTSDHAAIGAHLATWVKAYESFEPLARSTGVRWLPVGDFSGGMSAMTAVLGELGVPVAAPLTPYLAADHLPALPEHIPMGAAQWIKDIPGLAVKMQTLNYHIPDFS